MQEVTRIYNRTLVAVFKENRKVLKEMVQTSEKLFEEARTRKYGIMTTLRRLQGCDIDTGHFYVQVVDYLGGDQGPDPHHAPRLSSTSTTTTKACRRSRSSI